MDTLDPFRRYFRWAAVACSLASAALTMMFGLAQSEYWLIAAACALFLVACSLASDYINLFVIDAWRSRNYLMGGVMAAGAMFVFSLNLLSNLGSVGWQRDSTIREASVQNTKWEDNRAAVAENKRLLEAHSKRLAELEATNAWSTSVNAAALRAQLDSANLAIEQEARRGGCGRLCLERTRERDELMARIAVAEDMSETRRQIAGLKATLAKSREVAHATESTTAAPASQAAFFAGIATASLQPTDTASRWADRGIASWLALGLCIAPILFSLVGWKSSAAATPRRTEPDPPAEPTVTLRRTTQGDLMRAKLSQILDANNIGGARAA